MESFLNSINPFLNLMPDCRPKNIPNAVRVKSKVLYFPVTLVDNIILKREELQIGTDDQVSTKLIKHKIIIKVSLFCYVFQFKLYALLYATGNSDLQTRLDPRNFV